MPMTPQNEEMMRAYEAKKKKLKALQGDDEEREMREAWSEVEDAMLATGVKIHICRK